MSAGPGSGQTTHMYGRAPVVVGVDGSPSSWAAVLAGAWEAEQRNAPLVLAHGYLETYPYAAYGGWVSIVPSDRTLVEDATDMLDNVSARLAHTYPGLPVRTSLSSGGGPVALIEESRSAQLLVVGARGQGGFGGLSIGSTAVATSAHAACPVLVIRPPADEADGEQEAERQPVERLAAARRRPIFVGVDGSPQASDAIGFAFEEASLRRVPLVAVYVWWIMPAESLGPAVPGHYDAAVAEEQARRILAELMAGWASKYPDVAVHQRVEHGLNPSYHLINASTEAGLIVVGCRGRGGFSGLLLGSTSRDLIGHAASAVAVVR